MSYNALLILVVNLCYTFNMKIQKKIPTIDIEKYGGKQVAILDGKVIASGRTLGEVLQKARKKAPRRPLHDIKILAVPETLTVIYYVSRW